MQGALAKQGKKGIVKFPGLLIRMSEREVQLAEENRMRKSSLLLLLLVISVPANGQQSRVQERNKEVARSFFEEVLGQGRLDKYAESHAKDFVAHGESHEYTLEEAGMGFPATGKKIKIDGMTIFRFKAGKICEEWSVWDMLSAMRQAGLLPASQ
jgi:hypothetical protein